MPDDARDHVRKFLLDAAHGGNTRRLRACIGKLTALFPDQDGQPPGENTDHNEFWASPSAAEFS